MSNSAWTSGNRRTDALIVLVLVAASLGHAVYGSIWLCRFGFALTREGSKDVLPAGLDHALARAIWTAMVGFTSTIGLVIPLLIGAAALLHFVRVRLAIRFIAVFQAAMALILAGHGAMQLAQIRVTGAAFAGGFYPVIISRLLVTLGVCVLPICVLMSVGRATRTGGTKLPRRAAADLTRLALIVNGILLIARGGIWLTEAVAEYLSQGAAPLHLVVGIASAALIVMWGTVLVICGRLLIREARLECRAMWTAAFAELAGWLIVCGLTLLDCCQQNLPRMLNTGIFWPFLTSSCAYLGSTLPVTAVLLWYWWPVLRGWESVELRAGLPTCVRCGYCLVGNVSGRCRGVRGAEWGERSDTGGGITPVGTPAATAVLARQSPTLGEGGAPARTGHGGRGNDATYALVLKSLPSQPLARTSRTHEPIAMHA